jgi:hypothetical protein
VPDALASDVQGTAGLREIHFVPATGNEVPASDR